MAAKQGDTVRVHYKGTLEDGTVFDSSEGREPLQFTLGASQVIPGFESAVEGLEIGESRSRHVPVEEGYGLPRAEMVVELSRTEVPADLELELGQQLSLQHSNGQSILVRVSALTGETVTLDGNHPLAGQKLNFEVNLVEIVAGA